MSIRKKIRNDYYNHYDSIKKLIPAILNPSFQAVLLLRIAENASVITFWFWRTVLILKHSIDVGRGFSIGDNIRLPHPGYSNRWRCSYREQCNALSKCNFRDEKRRVPNHW